VPSHARSAHASTPRLACRLEAHHGANTVLLRDCDMTVLAPARSIEAFRFLDPGSSCFVKLYSRASTSEEYSGALKLPTEHHGPSPDSLDQTHSDDRDVVESLRKKIDPFASMFAQSKSEVDSDSPQNVHQCKKNLSKYARGFQQPGLVAPGTIACQRLYPLWGAMRGLRGSMTSYCILV
jgi:hypothetical protein